MNSNLPSVADKLYTISEASRILGVHPSTLRLWENQGLISPHRTPGGNRRYLFSDLQALLSRKADERRKFDGRIKAAEIPAPTIPVRDLAHYRPSPRYFLRKIAILSLALGLVFVFWVRLPNLSRERLERIVGFGVANPIVDVNDAFEYQITQERVSGLKSKFPFVTDFLRVTKSALFQSSRFLGTVFFGKGSDYFISPTGQASFNSVTSNNGEVTNLEVTNLTVTGTSTGTQGTGGNAGTLEGQSGSYYLDLDNEVGTCTDCLTGDEIDESSLTGISADDSDTVDGLDSTQFLRSDTSDSYTSGTLTFNVGTTLDINGILALPSAGISGAGAGSGLDADLLDGQQGSYFLDLDNETGTCANCLSTIEIDESTFAGLDSSNINDIYLFNTGDTGSGTYNFQDDVTLGSDSTDTLIVNSLIASDFIPIDNTRTLGSAGLRWDIGYFDELVVNTISAGAVDAGGTISSDWTINSDNATNDLEDSTITFERGTPVKNGVLRWDSANDQYLFEVFPLALDGQLISEVATGTSPFSVASTTLVANLNVDYLDDLDSTSFLRSDTIDNYTSGTLTFDPGTTLDVSAASLTLAIDQIDWVSVNKTGSSLADLDTRSAGDLTSGNLDSARLPTGGNWDLTSDLSIETDTVYVGADGGSYPGQVGIGTATPDATLSVNGDLRVASGATPVLGTDTFTNQSYDYTVSSITYDPETLTGGATAVVLTDDQVSANITIPFSFTFYGNTYTILRISSNGFVGFDSLSATGCCDGQSIPDADTPNNLIAGYWDDLDPSAGGTIQYEVFGTTPNQTFVIEFSGVAESGGSGTATFQIILYESSNNIEIHTNSSTSTNGELHTQGIENRSGRMAQYVSGRNAAVFDLTSDGARFAPSNSSTENGQVAIGSFTPTTGSALTVNNSIEITRGSSDMVLWSDNLTDALDILSGGFGSSTPVNFAAVLENGNNDIGLNGSFSFSGGGFRGMRTGASARNSGGSTYAMELGVYLCGISCLGPGGIGLDSGGTGFDFYDGSIAVYTFGGEMARFTNGELGIGTTSPSSKLTVAGTYDPLIDLNDGNDYPFMVYNSGGVTGTGTGIAFSVSTAASSNVGGAIVFKRTGGNSQGELQFYTKGSTTASADPVQRMVITNDGRLGVGTATPYSVAALDVVGINGAAIFSDNETASTTKQAYLNVKHYNNAEEPFEGISMTSFSTTNYLDLGGQGAFGNSATNIRLYTAANNTTVGGSLRMEVDASGNITATPGTGVFTVTTNRTTAASAGFLVGSAVLTQTGFISFASIALGNITTDGTNAITGLTLSAPGNDTASAATALNITGTNWDTDINLQNSETIDNNVDGIINLHTGNTAGYGIQIDSGTTQTVNALCHSGADSDTTFVDRIIVACNPGTLTDYAEYYPTSSDVDFGEIVVTGNETVQVNAGDGYGKIDPDRWFDIKKLVKATVPYEGGIIGITSKNFADFTALGQGQIHESDHPIPVALSGRVPVKIDPNSDSFAAGDMLTTSANPGMAQKATRAGQVVAKALNGWERGSGVTQVMVFIQVGYYDPLVGVDDSGDLSSSGDKIETSGLTEITAQEGIFQKITATIVGTFEKLVVKTATIASALVQELTAVLIKVDELQASKVNVSAPSVDTIKIAAGETKYFVDYAAITADSKVFLTPEEPVNVGVVVKAGENGFEISLSAPLDHPLNVSYWVIN